MEVWNNMIKYYRSDSKECYHEELEELKETLKCERCGNKPYVYWDYSSEEDSYYYCITCCKCTYINDGYYECFGTDWCNSLNEALECWCEMNAIVEREKELK
jgi:hypothetical protein